LREAADGLGAVKAHEQCGQMSLLLMNQNVAQPIFVKINTQVFPWEKCCPNICVTSKYYKNYRKKTIIQWLKIWPIWSPRPRVDFRKLNFGITQNKI
jgi:hypothetical protein